MKNLLILIVISVSCGGVLLAKTNQPFFQEDTAKSLTAEFRRSSKAPKTVNWAGNWTRPFRHAKAGLKITKISAKKIRFSIDALAGANIGEISGTADVSGNKALFDDRRQKNSDKTGCVLLFTHKGAEIEIKQSDECSNYGGAGVVFIGDYKRGNPPLEPRNLFDADVFPNAKIDAEFRKLVGRDYQTFLDSFQMISEDEDADNLGAKVYSACVRGICNYMAGIIMYDQKGRIWAAVMSENKKTEENELNYFTNDSAWSDKLPETINKWKNESRAEAKVVYRNKK